MREKTFYHADSIVRRRKVMELLTCLQCTYQIKLLALPTSIVANDAF
jgi:hypothetical protein